MNMLTTLVTPQRRNNRKNWCEERLASAYGTCGCFKARLQNICPCCYTPNYIDDCIKPRNGDSGWVHTKCPTDRGGERGIAKITASLNPEVDYGGSFLTRPTQNGEQRSLPSPRRLDFDGSTFKIPAASLKRPNEKDYYSTPKKGAKRAKHEGILATNKGEGDYAKDRRTDEQMKILKYEPSIGEVVAVNALAGCGKTTTIACLCNKIKTERPGESQLYLVFSKKAADEAIESRKFPMGGMEIRTTHSYVLRTYFGVANSFKNVNSTGGHKVEDIIEELDLIQYCGRMFGKALQNNKRKVDKRTRTIAGYIRNTVNNFQASADRELKEDHVFWRARKNTNLTTRTKWREKIKVKQYMCWANQFFDTVIKQCRDVASGGATQKIDIPFDAYMKVAQLSELHIDADYIFIDEAQDMTACQAALFWGEHQRSGKVIYLFGDKHQQLYRFRGASTSFEVVTNAPDTREFSLTGSFRFGKNIASCASCVLQSVGGQTLHGRSRDEGIVEVIEGEGDDRDGNDKSDDKDCNDEGSSSVGSGSAGSGSVISGSASSCYASSGSVESCEGDDNDTHHDEVQENPDKCVVLCRTRNGIFRYLFANMPRRWCYLNIRCKLTPRPERWMVDLESFMTSEEKDGSSTFRYKGEKFTSIADIEEYIDDEGDNILHKALTLLTFLVSQNTSITNFYSSLSSSFVPMKENESPDNYCGVVMSTVHQAKGLEFECPVVVSDDFNFKAIRSLVINSSRRCDEANILYVAITRAKQHLCLTIKAKKCLDSLSKLSHVKADLPVMCSLSLSRDIYRKWKKSWIKWKSDPDDDVPYPPNWEECYPFALHHGMDESEQRKQLYMILRAYHPDKFIPRYRDVIQKEELEKITQKCTDLLESLRDTVDEE